MQQKIVVAGAAVLAVALALPAAAVIFTAGGDSRCDRAQDAYADLRDRARWVDSQAGGTEQEALLRQEQLADTLASLIVSAPECFTPADVAGAQQRIDMRST